MEYLEMLAKLGVGDAHPGGFDATLELLRAFPIPEGTRILEVGCGTGLTACYLASLGYHVTAVDVREDMIRKAKLRAEGGSFDLQIVQADARALPFAMGEFDVVLAESVTIFTDAPLALKEYRRVLSNKGMLYDREIVAMRDLSLDVKQSLRRLYGFDRLFCPEEWKELLTEAGFDRAEPWKLTPFPSIDHQSSSGVPDLEFADEDALFRDDLWETVYEYAELHRQFGKYFGYAVMIGSSST
jgi:SAM-dependent methyltransferase